jgi:hypothetical protein
LTAIRALQCARRRAIVWRAGPIDSPSAPSIRVAVCIGPSSTTWVDRDALPWAEKVAHDTRDSGFRHSICSLAKFFISRIFARRPARVPDLEGCGVCKLPSHVLAVLSSALAPAVSRLVPLWAVETREDQSAALRAAHPSSWCLAATWHRATQRRQIPHYDAFVAFSLLGFPPYNPAIFSSLCLASCLSLDRWGT